MFFCEYFYCYCFFQLKAISGSSHQTRNCGSLCGAAQVQTDSDSHRAAASRPAWTRSRANFISKWSQRFSCGARRRWAQGVGVCAAHIGNNRLSKDCEGTTQVYTSQHTASEVSKESFMPLPVVEWYFQSKTNPFSFCSDLCFRWGRMMWFSSPHL